MSNIVNASGLSCPQPVIIAKKALTKGPFPVVIIVDTTTACENVTRMATNAGYTVRVDPIDDEFKIIINKK